MEVGFGNSILISNWNLGDLDVIGSTRREKKYKSEIFYHFQKVKVIVITFYFPLCMVRY